MYTASFLGLSAKHCELAWVSYVANLLVCRRLDLVTTRDIISTRRSTRPGLIFMPSAMLTRSPAEPGQLSARIST